MGGKRTELRQTHSYPWTPNGDYTEPSCHIYYDDYNHGDDEYTICPHVRQSKLTRPIAYYGASKKCGKTFWCKFAVKSEKRTIATTQTKI
jgi:hypothetical protein